jgi:hypothetical protein
MSNRSPTSTHHSSASGTGTYSHGAATNTPSPPTPTPEPNVRVNESEVDGEVRNVTRNGREYLVFPIVAAREMILDYPEYGTRELLSSDRLRESVEMWAGTPITFIHPENPQRTADLPEEYTETIIGQAYNPNLVDREKLRVQAWVDVEKATDIGGLAADVVEQLQDGEQVSVSAGYATLDDDTSGGTYNNGEYDIEQGHIIPDHIAVFPSDEFTARCSWEDGCGAPRANARQNTKYQSLLGPCETQPGECSPGACSCGYHANALSEARTPTYDGLTSDAWEPPTFTDYAEEYYTRQDTDAPDEIAVDTVSDDALAFVAERTLVGSADDPDSAGQVRSYPVVNLEDELNEDALTSARLLAHHSDAESSIRSHAADLLESHSGEWPSGNEYDFEEPAEQSSDDARVNASGPDRFETQAEAEQRAVELGCDGSHQHEDPETGEVVYMPCTSHIEWEGMVGMRENIAGPSGNVRYLRAGEYVKWDSEAGTRYGKIRAVERDGCVSLLDPDTRKCADGDDERVVNISVYADDVPTGERVLKRVVDGGPNEDNLRSWDASRSARLTREFPRGLSNTNANAVDESDMLTFEEGEMVRLQAIPSIYGSVDHIPDNQSGDVTIAMVDLFDQGMHTISIGMGGLMPMDGRMNRVNAVTAEIGDRTVDLTPPDAVVNAAEAALAAKRDEYPDELGDCGTGRGEQRAEQIVNGDLAPEDFLTRENGTPIPTYLDSHSEDVPSSVESTPTDWSEEIWLNGCGSVQYALWGGTGTGTGLEWAEGVKDDLEAAIEAAEDFSLNAHISTMSTEPIDPDDLHLRHNVVPYLQQEWEIDDPGLVEVFTNALDPDTPGNAQAFAATIAHNYEGVDAVEVQTLLAEAEARGTATIDLNYEPPEVEIDGGVGPHIDRLNARDHITPFLAEKWETDRTEATAVINALDSDHPDDFRALLNVYPGEYEEPIEDITGSLRGAIDTGNSESDDPDAPVTTNAAANADPETMFGKFLASLGWSPDGQTTNAAADEPTDPDDGSAESGSEPTANAPDADDDQTPDESDEPTDARVNAMSADDYVMWDWSGDTAYGQIEEVVEEGSRTVDGNTREVEADDGEMIAVISHLSEDGEDQDQRVLKYIRSDGENEDNLRSWDAPESARGNATTSGSDTTTDDTQQNTENSLTMELTINELASQTAFGVTELQDWSDEKLAALEATINAGSDADAGSDSDGAEPTENAEHGSHGGDDDEDEDDEDEEDDEMHSNYDEKINDLEQSLTEVRAMVEDIANEKANAEKEEQARIVANAVQGMTKEAALQLPEDDLEDLADAHANTVNFGAIPGDKDRTPTPRANATDEDVESYPAGGRSAWEERKRSGGD